MRKSLIAAAMLCVTFGPSAWADPTTAKFEPPGTAGIESNAEAQAIAALQELNRKLEAAGYKDVQVLPEALVVSAKDGNGQQTLLLIDTKTMMALQLEAPAKSDTTGSGSVDEGNR
jgi:hypothetical protein